MFINWFINFGQVHDYLVYGVIVVASFFEGPVLALLCGLILRMGILAIIPTYVALMLGDLIGDMVWYWIGRRFGHRFVKRYGRYFDVDEAGVAAVEKIYHRHSSLILMLSKLTMGFGFAIVTLVTAGMVKIPFRRYVALNLIGQIVWTAAIMAIGFFLGHLYVTFDNIFARVSIVSLTIIAIIGIFRYARFIRRQISKASRENQ